MLAIYLCTQAASVGWYLYQPIAHAWFAMLQQATAKDEETSLLVLTIQKDQLAILENEDGEVTIDGTLYDIEHAATKGDQIKLWLQKDQGETNWKDHYSHLNNLLHKNKAARPVTTGKAHTIFFAFFHNRYNAKLPGLHLELTHCYHSFSSPVYHAPQQELLIPPPKYC